MVTGVSQWPWGALIQSASCPECAVLIRLRVLQGILALPEQQWLRHNESIFLEAADGQTSF